DIRPANIFYNSISGDLTLCNFGPASLLPSESYFGRRSSLQELSNTIEEEHAPAAATQEQSSRAHGALGSLAYMSPEQTGRMNRSVDYRSDYYSLGVTLFELATGRLPFYAEHPLEYVHLHMAAPPPRV